MSLWSYKLQPYAIRLPAVLTNSYVAGTDIVSTDQDNQLMLYIDIALGSLTSVELKTEFFDNSAGNPFNSQTVLFQETFSSISGGTSTETLGVHTFTASGKYRLAIPTKDKNIRISVKGSGTVTGSSCAVYAINGIA